MEIKNTNTILSDKEALAAFLLEYKTIECFGLQGSGKTTLVHWLNDNFDMEIVTPGTIWRTSWKKHALFFCLKHISLTLWWSMTALVESMRVNQLRLFFHKIHMMLVLAARWEYLHSHFPAGTRLLDEGFMQAILSLYEHQVSQDTMSRILHRFPSSDCAVYLVAPPIDGLGKVSKRRLALGQDYVRQWKNVFTCNLSVLTRVLRERNQAQFVTLNEMTKD